MPIKIKKNGAYVDPVATFVKKNGVYAAVQGVYAKKGGAYQLMEGVVVPPTAFRSIYTMELESYPDWNGRAALRDSKRTSLTIRNVNSRAIQYARSTATNDNRNNPGSFTVLAPGQEVYITSDINQYWVQPRVIATTAMTSVGTTATVTAPSHGLSSGDVVEVIKAVPSGYRSGSVAVTVVDANTITYTTATADMTAATTQGGILVKGLIVEIEILGVL